MERMLEVVVKVREMSKFLRFEKSRQADGKLGGGCPEALENGGLVLWRMVWPGTRDGISSVWK